MLVAPGAYDCVSALLVEQAGFGAVYMTGAGVSAARGYPDFGLLTLTEMADAAGAMARSVSIPLIADADTGFGNELNVTRTVREYEARGVAALHIEDQVSPKRCGHLDGKEVIDRQAFVSKILAAVQARRSPGMLIIARTDSLATHGLDEAVARATAALAAGADMAFVEATRTLEEAAAVPRLVAGPCVLNMVHGGRTPVTDLRQAEAMGYRLAILPALMVMAAIEAGDAALAALKATGQTPRAAQDVAAVFRRLGAGEWETVRERFGAGEPMQVVRAMQAEVQ